MGIKLQNREKKDPELLEAKEAISKFFGNTNRTRQQTRDGLEELATDIEAYISSLVEDTE